MWDKPTLLIWLANLFFAISVVLMMYGLLFAFVHLPIFPIKQVKMMGEINHVNREQVQLIVDEHLKGNFFTLDLVKTREAFEKLPWARTVSVRRQWPDALNVEIEEHKVLARWGDIALVNTRGELFHAAIDAELPLFYGPGDGIKEVSQHYIDFSKILNRAEIKIAQVTLSPRRAWEIKTDKNLVISLGRLDMSERLNKFTTVYQSVLSHLGAEIKYADLRYPNGFAVRKPEKLSMRSKPRVHENAFRLV
jgi:cell division protein FtsQ